MMPARAQLAAIVETLIGVILRAYPRAFRIRFKREILDSARQELHEAARAGAEVFAVVAFREVSAAVAGVLPQRRQERRRRRTQEDAAPSRGQSIRTEGIVQSVIQDVLGAGRFLRRQPGFTAVVVLTVAIAIGLAAALFSVIDAAVLRPLPFPEPERIVRATVRTRIGDRVSRQAPSLDELRNWSESGVFTAIAAWNDAFADAIVERPAPARARIREITEGYLAVYGVAPILGREFSAGDAVPAAEPVVLLSHVFWQHQFGADRNAVGRSIRYDGTSATVVGVLPAGFYPGVTLWRPMRLDAEGAVSRGSTGTVYARLRSGVSLDDAARRLSAITPAEDGRSPAAGAGPDIDGRVQLASVLDETVRRYRTTVAVLAGAVGLIVLLACVNVAGLLLAHGSSRQPELAIRASIGAGRLRLIRQLLIEAVLLSLAGGLAGTFAAWLSLDALLAILPLTLPPGTHAELDLRVLGAAMGLAVFTGLVFGTWPAIRLSRVSVGLALARGGRGHTSALSRRSGQMLMAAEVALAVVLVLGAGLMIRSFARLTSVDLGFDPNGIVAFRVVPIDPSSAVHAPYYLNLLEAIRATPGIEATGAVDFFALRDEAIAGSASGTARSLVGIRQVLPGYLEAMRFRLRQGRFPGPADGDAVAVISESAASALFPDVSDVVATGQGLTLRGRTFQVAGVIADSLHGGPAGLSRPEAFVPLGTHRSFPGTGMTFVVRPAGRWSGDLATTLRRTAESIGPRVLVDTVRPGREWFSDLVATPRHRMTLLGLLGSCGLMLALVGIFSTIAYAVTRRTREIGVRMALGARPAQVVRRMVRDAGWPVLIGIASGLAAAFYASRVLQSFLFETMPQDPATFAATAVLIASAALAAAWLPARRAARIDPVAVLRAE
jgi:predicted permease